MMTNYITIIHTAFLAAIDVNGKIVREPKVVGLVDVGHLEEEARSKATTFTASVALEYAFAQTQNLEESWTEIEGNHTFVEGASYRSTSVGDRMIFNGDIYRVASSGFQNVIEMANEGINPMIEDDKNHFKGKRLDRAKV